MICSSSEAPEGPGAVVEGLRGWSLDVEGPTALKESGIWNNSYSSLEHQESCRTFITVFEYGAILVEEAVEASFEDEPHNQERGEC